MIVLLDASTRISQPYDMDFECEAEYILDNSIYHAQTQ